MLLITLVVCLYSIWKIGKIVTTVPHAVLGTITTAAVGVIYIGGLVARLMLERSKWNTKWNLRIKMTHRVFGVLLLLFSQSPLVTGQFFYALNHHVANNIMIVHMVLWPILLIVFEGTY